MHDDEQQVQDDHDGSPTRVIPLAGSSSKSPVSVMLNSFSSSTPASRAALPIHITRAGSANPTTRLMVSLLTVALTTAAPRSRRARCAAVYALGKLMSEARITPPPMRAEDAILGQAPTPPAPAPRRSAQSREESVALAGQEAMTPPFPAGPCALHGPGSLLLPAGAPGYPAEAGGRPG